MSIVESFQLIHMHLYLHRRPENLPHCQRLPPNPLLPCPSYPLDGSATGECASLALVEPSHPMVGSSRHV